MESIREEVVDIRSCIAYLMVKWKILLLALILGALAGGALGVYKQKSAAAPTQVSYEEKLETLRGALQETNALYVEQVYTQYNNYGKQLGNWNRYLKDSALQSMSPDNYIKRDLQYIVESDNSDVISSFSVSLLGTSDYERIADVCGDDVTASNAVELISVSNVTQADSATAAAAVQVGEIVSPDIPVGVASNSYRSIMDVMFVAPDEETADAMEEILREILEERQRELKESGVDVEIENLNKTTVANDYTWLLAAQQAAIAPMQALQTTRSNFVKNSVDVLGDKEKAYFEALCQGEAQTEAAKTTVSVKKVNKKKLVAAGGLGLFVLAFGVILLMFIYSDRIRAEEQLKRSYGLPVLLRCRIGKGRLGIDPLRKWALGVLTGADAAEEAENGAGKLAAELAHRIPGGPDKAVYLACDTDKREVRTAAGALAESLKEKGINAQAGRPAAGDEAYEALLASDAVVVVETMNVSGALALKDLLGVCERNSLPVLGCVTLTDVSKY